MQVSSNEASHIVMARYLNQAELQAVTDFILNSW